MTPLSLESVEDVTEALLFGQAVEFSRNVLASPWHSWKGSRDREEIERAFVNGFVFRTFAPAAKPLSDCGGEWPESLMIRDTKIHDDSGGLGQRIFTTAGAGYEKRKYIRADLAASPTTRDAGGVPVAEVSRKGNATGGLVWTDAGARADLMDGTKLYATPTPAGDLAAKNARLREMVSRYASECGECEGRGYIVSYVDPYGRGDVSSPERTPCAECADIHDALATATPQAASVDAKDAARWRYVSKHRDVALLTAFFGNGCMNKTIGDVEAAIDAALDRSGAEGQS